MINCEEDSPFTPGNIITDLEVTARSVIRDVSPRVEEEKRKNPSVVGRRCFCPKPSPQPEGTKPSGAMV